MKAWVTGSEGFVGKHLVNHLEEQDYSVYGYNLRHGQDIRDYEQVRNTLDIVRPDEIYHLAAQAFVPESFNNPQRTFEVNVLGSIAILEAVRQLNLKTKVLLVGTSEEYGDAGDGLITENTLPAPKSPYAVAKLAMGLVGKQYATSYGMHVVHTRAFNHTGPGRGEMYAESSFAKQIVECEMGLRSNVKHGNLESVRNYTDVRDMVRAYVMAIGLPPDVYNICTDKSVTMDKVLQTLINNSSINAVESKVDESLYRPNDFSFKKPSCEKFKKLSGWKPEYKFETTMADLLNYWRQRLDAN